MSTHDPNLKGNVAELKIAAEAARLGIEVLRPMTEHCRYDLAFDLGHRLLRIQCKSAALKGSVVAVGLQTNRRGPEGYISTRYSAEEIDAVAAYSPDLDECFYLPIELVEGMTAIHLRLRPAKNGQIAALHFAADYRLGAVAQLGERRAGSAKAVGSSPTSSIPIGTGPEPAPIGAHEYRNRFGWYMERAAAGETFVITRRGKPYARLSPAQEQLAPAA